MYARHVNELMWLDVRRHGHIFESSQLEGSYVGDLLYMLLIVESTQKIRAQNSLSPCFHRVYCLGRMVDRDDNTHIRSL